MLNCKHLVEHASDYIDEELSGWQRVKVKMHLFLCVSCRRYVNQLRTTVKMLGRRTVPEAPEAMCQQLVETYQKTLPKQG